MNAVVNNRTFDFAYVDAGDSVAVPVEQHWNQWQSELLAVLQGDLKELLHEISLDDVDWPSWYRFFMEGRSPRAAVMRGLERDL